MLLDFFKMILRWYYTSPIIVLRNPLIILELPSEFDEITILNM